MSYRHINRDDRIIIATLLDEQRSKSYVARRLGVDRSTIGREIARGSTRAKPKPAPPPRRPKILDVDGRSRRGTGFTKDKHEALDAHKKACVSYTAKHKYYYSSLANKRAIKRRKVANQLRVRIVYGSRSFEELYVIDKLTGEQWSPEQIVGRLMKDHGVKMSPQTVYDYIYSSPDKKKLTKHLRHHGNRYRRKRGTAARVKNQKRTLPSIHDRDPVVETRTRLDDYEGDTVVGLDKKDRLLTYADRTSGECLIGLVLGYDAHKIAAKTIQLTATNAANPRTITYDRGTEFADYETIQKQTNSRIYFADAYSSYQRGTNENLNGLIRQYCPKRSDFKLLTERQVNIIQNKLNNRPRKRYNWRTPVEQRAYLLNLQIVAVRD
jgi:transposase, IS30 family